MSGCVECNATHAKCSLVGGEVVRRGGARKRSKREIEEEDEESEGQATKSRKRVRRARDDPEAMSRLVGQQNAPRDVQVLLDSLALLTAEVRQLGRRVDRVERGAFAIVGTLCEKFGVELPDSYPRPKPAPEGPTSGEPSEEEMEQQ